MPEQLTPATRVGYYATGFDKAGYQVVAFNLDDADPTQRDHGQYSLHAAASPWPAMAMGDPPQISGIAAAGNILTTSPGVWAPTPSSVDVTWYGAGCCDLNPSVSGANYPVRRDDSGRTVSVVVAARAPFHRMTQWTQSAAIARLATGLTDAAPRTVSYGHPVTVSGTLTSRYGALTGNSLSLSLYARPASGGTWTRVARAALTSNPVRVSFTPRVSTQWQWRFAGSDSLAAASGRVHTVVVTPIVSAHATRLAPRAGTRDAVWGAVSPRSAGQYVAVQRYSGGTWHTIGNALLTRQRLPDGSTRVGYLWRFTPQRPGTWRLRVVRRAQAGLATGVSRTVTIQVR